MADRIPPDTAGDAIDRRGFLSCMAWAGTGLACTLSGGVLSSRLLGQDASARGDFTFVQISDSHVGFKRPPNRDVVGTLERAVARINALPEPPAFVLHTGDLTHLARPDEFDTVAEVLKGIKGGKVLCVPGEHDISPDDGKRYRERFGKDTRGTGWYSFDHKGVHFVGLDNVTDPQASGLGALGKEQLAWLKKDVAGLAASTPVVVFAHVPLWTVYEKWGWGTRDAEQALALLKRFGSVTVLNGHVHQVLQKVEGKVTFHTACSTAFPQPAPSKAPSPGPVKDVPADRLRRVLGLTKVRYTQGKDALAIIDPSLE